MAAWLSRSFSSAPTIRGENWRQLHRDQREAEHHAGQRNQRRGGR
jgi:hypothetical protein